MAKQIGMYKRIYLRDNLLPTNVGETLSLQHCGDASDVLPIDNSNVLPIDSSNVLLTRYETIMCEDDWAEFEQGI